MDGIGSHMQNVTDSIGSVSDSMRETNEGIKYTKDAIRKQTLALALKEMVLLENNTFVSPDSTTPTSMIPSAKMFGEVATPEEIKGIFFLWLTEINQGQISPLTDANKDNADKIKWIKITALQTIAGMLTEKKLQLILEKGLYADSIPSILLCRYLFISTYVLDLGVLTKPKLTAEDYEAGLTAINSLRSIEGLPEAKNATLRLYGFYDRGELGLNQDVKLEAKAEEYFKKLESIPKQ